MDISNEANVDPFSIGPTSIMGRTIAFRVLFCKSMSQLRRDLFRFFLNCFLTFKLILSPFVSWFHPRNPQGILAVVTIIAFVLKRYTNVKTKAEMAYRRKFWRNMMRAALTYEEWAHAAKMLEKETPKMNESDLYDEELVKNKLQELRHRRQEGSLRDIMFCMRADLVRNLGNMHRGRRDLSDAYNEETCVRWHKGAKTWNHIEALLLSSLNKKVMSSFTFMHCLCWLRLSLRRSTSGRRSRVI